MSILESFIMDYYFYLLTIIFAFFGIYLVLNIEFLWNWVKKSLDKKTLLILIFIILFGSLLRVSNFQQNDFVESISSEYKLGAKTLLTYQKYYLCEEGSFNNCTGHVRLPRHVWGYPYLLSGFFLIFGSSNESAYLFNFLLSLTTMLLSYFLTYSFSKNKYISLISALFIAVSFKHIYWITENEVNTINILFIGLCFFLLKLSQDYKSVKLFLLTFFAILLTSHIRAENILILPFFFVLLFSNRKEILNKKENFNYLYIIFSVIIGLILLIFTLIILNHASTQHGQLISYSRFLMQIKFLLQFYVYNLHIVFIFLIIFMIFNKKIKSLPIISICVYLIMHTIAVLIFRANDPNYGTTERYLMYDYMIITTLASLGFLHFSNFLGRLIKKRGIKTFIVILLVIFLFSYTISSTKNSNIKNEEYKLESATTFDEIIVQLKPDYLYINSLEITEYLQFKYDDLQGVWIPNLLFLPLKECQYNSCFYIEYQIMCGLDGFVCLSNIEDKPELFLKKGFFYVYKLP